ncbi:MAG: lipoyl(octanoyl) transferase LipB, partial [Clostridiales bacterium]|nr:lipoyl(octanoyl) transferase LipB [Clostridiales bacterium]
EILDSLLIVEHPAVLTMGKRGNEDNVLVSQEMLKNENIETVWINRGGDVTYHGPGQLVGYPIMSLVENKIGIKVFVDNIQETIIQYLRNEFDINAIKKSGVHTGVWVNDRKVTAIGISVKRGVTLHGFAFNINTNLAHFDYINPCGLGAGMVTSLQEIVGTPIDYTMICDNVIQSFCKIFGATPIYTTLEKVLEEKHEK